ncbi:MAG: hypothetical protein JNK77_18735 [Saprospiraceae bacterium]|nr:hypothetical protein [Saprospiraceae bacterium]
MNVDKVEAMQKSRLKIAGMWLPIGETYAEG